MNRDDVIRMAREAGMPPVEIISDKPVLYPVPDAIERFAALVAAAERNKLAAWMIRLGFATGHGDTMEQLLDALGTEIVDRIEIEVDTEREACAEIVWPKLKIWSEEEQTAMNLAFNKAQEKHGWYETLMAVGASVLKLKADAIRARGQV